jgi:hypothetical protein
MGQDDELVRQATADDAEEIARLLHDFNTEFDAPSPGAEVLAERLRLLLAGRATIVILAGSPAVAVALITLRRNVWYAGDVALLDELYVEPRLRGGGDRLGHRQRVDVDLARARRRPDRDQR